MKTNTHKTTLTNLTPRTQNRISRATSASSAHQDNDILKWNISILGETENTHLSYIPSEPTDGNELCDYIQKGYNFNNEVYSKLTKRISKPYMRLVNDYISNERAGLFTDRDLSRYKVKTFDNLMTTINNYIKGVRRVYGELDGTYTEYMEEHFISHIKEADVKLLISYYFIYKGVLLGYIDKTTPVDFMDIHINPQEILDLYLITQGCYNPSYLTDDTGQQLNDESRLDAWRKGIYSTYSYRSVVFISQQILREQPEYIGCRNLINIRNRKIDDIIGKAKSKSIQDKIEQTLF